MLHTITYTKLFTSGILKGLEVPATITASPSTLERFHVGRKLVSYGSKSTYIITSVTYHNA